MMSQFEQKNSVEVDFTCRNSIAGSVYPFQSVRTVTCIIVSLLLNFGVFHCYVLS